MTKDRRLGKGLAALLGTPLEADGGFGESELSSRSAMRTVETVHQRVAAAGFRVDPETMEVSASGVASMELEVSFIDANPFQPRRSFNESEIASLAASIQSHQQLQPILVRKVGDRYQLISGERRLRATIHAGLSKIRAEVREADDRLVAELAIIENLQRKDLNAIEKALSFKRYIAEHRCTQEELAGRLKIDRATIANLMRLLELPPLILELVQNDQLLPSMARAMLALSTEELQMQFLQRAQKEGWSVREMERRVSEQAAKEESEELGLIGKATAKRTRSKSINSSENIASLELSLKQQLGTQVEIRQSSKGAGKLVIHFTNSQEFERLRRVLDPTQVSLAKAS